MELYGVNTFAQGLKKKKRWRSSACIGQNQRNRRTNQLYVWWHTISNRGSTVCLVCIGCCHRSIRQIKVASDVIWELSSPRDIFIRSSGKWTSDKMLALFTRRPGGQQASDANFCPIAHRMCLMGFGALWMLSGLHRTMEVNWSDVASASRQQRCAKRAIGWHWLPSNG
jgi:hypothetical protein